MFHPTWVSKFLWETLLKRDKFKVYSTIVRKPSGLMGLESRKCLLITSLALLKMVDKTQWKRQLLIPISGFPVTVDGKVSMSEKTICKWVPVPPTFLRHPPLDPACPPPLFKIFVSPPLFSVPPPFKVF